MAINFALFLLDQTCYEILSALFDTLDDDKVPNVRVAEPGAAVVILRDKDKDECWGSRLGFRLVSRWG